MRSALVLLSAVALLAGCEDPAPPPAETVVEAGQIQIVHPDEYLEESDGTALLRKLATPGPVDRIESSSSMSCLPRLWRGAQ